MESIQTAHAPQAIGPYSQAVKVNGMIFCSGQIPLDPTTVQVVEGDAHAELVLLLARLETFRAALDDKGADAARAHLAVGEGRVRLIRQMLTESALIALLGGALGLLAALWRNDTLVSLIPEDTLPASFDIGIDRRVRLFTFSLSLLTALLCGLCPAQCSDFNVWKELGIDLGNSALKG